MNAFVGGSGRFGPPPPGGTGGAGTGYYLFNYFAIYR